jgi:hypothetical protein
MSTSDHATGGLTLGGGAMLKRDAVVFAEEGMVGVDTTDNEILPSAVDENHLLSHADRDMAFPYLVFLKHFDKQTYIDAGVHRT